MRIFASKMSESPYDTHEQEESLRRTKGEVCREGLGFFDLVLS